jgi:hypothetical protein
MDEELIFRLKRMHSAIGETIKMDFTDIKQKTIDRGNSKAYIIDFNGGYTDEQISNFAHMAISNVASFYVHLKKWIAKNGMNDQEFNRLFAESTNIKAIIDLNNNDKHGYPRRDKGYIAGL